MPIVQFPRLPCEDAPYALDVPAGAPADRMGDAILILKYVAAFLAGFFVASVWCVMILKGVV